LILIGYFENEENAAWAYNQKAISFFGEYAALNTVTQHYVEKVLNKGNTSGYLGVWLNNKNSKFIAEIKHQNKKIHIGSFVTAIEAAKAYNQAAIKYRGEKAKLNYIEEI